MKLSHLKRIKRLIIPRLYALEFEPDVGLLSALLHGARDHLLLRVLLQRKSDLASLVRAPERYHVVDHLQK